MSIEMAWRLRREAQATPESQTTKKVVAAIAAWRVGNHLCTRTQLRPEGPMNTWILVADASRARLYQATSRRHIELLLELNHPEGRTPSRELVSDRSAIAPHTDHHRVELGRFAERLAATLHEGAARQAYTALVLVAPPHFLGELRKRLDGPVAHRVIATLDKDLTTWRELDLVAALREHLTTVETSGHSLVGG